MVAWSVSHNVISITSNEIIEQFNISNNLVLYASSNIYLKHDLCSHCFEPITCSIGNGHRTLNETCRTSTALHHLNISWSRKLGYFSDEMEETLIDSSTRHLRSFFTALTLIFIESSWDNVLLCVGQKVGDRFVY